MCIRAYEMKKIIFMIIYLILSKHAISASEELKNKIYKNLLFFFKQDRIDENGLKLTALELAYLFPKIYLDLDFQRFKKLFLN